MPSQQDQANVHHHIAEGTRNRILDVFGPTVEFLTSPDDARGDFCVMRGVIPPGVAIPLHSHDDTEEFFIVAGTQQVLTPGARGLEWSDVHAGDYVHVPGGTPHAHRNVSPDPAIDLIITTARLGRFFQEAGRPITGPLQPPTPDEVARFVAISAKYGHTLGAPEENAAVGIEMRRARPRGPAGIPAVAEDAATPRSDNQKSLSLLATFGSTNRPRGDRAVARRAAATVGQAWPRLSGAVIR